MTALLYKVRATTGLLLYTSGIVSTLILAIHRFALEGYITDFSNTINRKKIRPRSYFFQSISGFILDRK